MSKAKSAGWGHGALRLLINNAAQTQPYHFETGETKHVESKLSLDQRAERCRAKRADLAIARMVLDDAKNHVVDAEGDLIKAELALEREQAEFDAAAADRCGKEQHD